MRITFDTVKNAINIEKHGMSLVDAEHIEWDTLWAMTDTRQDYGEVRMIGYALIQSRLHVIVYTDRALSVYAKQINARYKIMLLTTKSGRVVEMPTDEENALIEAGIASDVDTYELSAAEFSQLKHIGRPLAEKTKARITMRIDRDTLNMFKSRAETTGGNYQTLINDALRKYAQQELQP
jgi:uncharacterized DUF497 family protein/uncharacterized protein (DUF4415 family)